MALRPYQSRMLMDVERGFVQGHKKLCLQLPTGGGKTVIAAGLISHPHLLRGRVLYIVPSDEILKQTEDMLESAKVSYVVVHGPGVGKSIGGVRVVLTTSQTLQRRMGAVSFAGYTPDAIIYDEAHKLIEQHRSVQKRWPRAVAIGLTATPVRLDGKSLAALFPVLICGPSISGLQKAGWLVSARTVPATMPDLSRIKMVAGDYDAGALDAAYGDEALVQEIVDWWRVDGRRRRTITFAAGIHASKRLVAAYNRAGARAEHLDGGTSKEVRKDALDRLRRGELDVVCNVGLFVEGLDLVEVSCVQLATATCSLSRYMQMVGRGLRPAPHVNKRDLVIIDHGGNSDRHGMVDAERDWYADGAISARRLCEDCNEPVDVDGQTVCTPHLKARLAAAEPAPMRRQRQERAESLRTPYRNCPAWAKSVRETWERSERARVAAGLPLWYSEQQCKREIA